MILQRVFHVVRCYGADGALSGWDYLRSYRDYGALDVGVVSSFSFSYASSHGLPCEWLRVPFGLWDTNLPWVVFENVYDIVLVVEDAWV